MDKYINALFKYKFMVLFVAVGLGIGGFAAWKYLPIDAFPDVTNVQVMVLTEAEGLAPAEVERLISFPLEIELSGLPDVKMVRSTSKSGLSQVVIIFKDNVDIYFARELVFQRIQQAKERLPEGYEPEMGTISTGLGEIYQYTLESDSADLMSLRTMHDWVVKPYLRSIPGVYEVNSFGGYLKQYQVLVDPGNLLKYDLELSDVTEALENNNITVPGSYIVKGAEQAVVRGSGLLRDIKDIENIVVESHKGVPVLLKNVADVVIGHEPRWGASTRDAKGERVLGMVVMLKGANSKKVAERVKEGIANIQKRLPQGTRIVPFYDRTELIEACINTISNALMQGGFLVIVVLFLLLGSFRASVVVCFSLILTVLISFIIMRLTGQSANLMSLGGLAIAIGMIVDANIVVSENIYRHLSSEEPDASKVTVCLSAVTEVIKPISFSVAIILLVFVPLFALQDVEGKMFKPLAISLMIVMFAALIVSTTVTPVLGLIFVKGNRKGGSNRILNGIQRRYLPVLNWAVDHKRTTAICAVLVLLLPILFFGKIGTEFIPYLDEGSIAINVVKYPTISLEESKRIGQKLEKMILEFPEISTVVTKTGRAEIAEDPMGPEQNDIFVMLKPQKEWKERSKVKLIDKMQRKLGVIPGIKLNFSQPIALRVNELISGIKSDVAIKIFGHDLELLAQTATSIEQVVSQISGAEDIKVEQVGGFLLLDIDIDRDKIARHGIDARKIGEIIETAIGGKEVGVIFEEGKQFDIAVRFPERYRKNERLIGDILVPTASNARVQLRELADIKYVDAPNQISRENAMRRIVIEGNVRGRDIGSFVAEAKDKISAIERNLPSGYYVEWAGQFENQQRAMRTLSIVIPIVALLIFIMLLLALNSVKLAMLIMMNLPFALVGGVIAVVVTNSTLSVSAMVGFIVLFGTAVQNGVVLVTFFNQLKKQGHTIKEVIRMGCELRLRPLLLTSLTTMFGLMPLIWASGSGAEIQRPLAIVVIGGLLSSWVLTLIVLPAIYGWVEKMATADPIVENA